MSGKKNENVALKNMEFWNSVAKTDPAHTTPFGQEGEFKGTAIRPLYVIQKVTSVWGPIGLDWGFDEVENKIEQGVWFSKVRVWYKRSLLREGEEGVGELFQWGGTMLRGFSSRSGATYTDEEAAKKSVTDGLKKCLTYLGFMADVHMGLFDDCKYVDSLKREKAARKAAQPAPAPQQPKDGDTTYAQENPGAESAPPEEIRTPEQGAQPAPEPSEEELQKILAKLGLPALDGVQYSLYLPDTGQRYVCAEGDTRNKKNILKEAGFRWSSSPSGWFLPAN